MISGFQGLEGLREKEKNEQWRTGGFQCSETPLYGTVMVGTCHYTFVRTHTMNKHRCFNTCLTLKLIISTF